MKRRFMWFILCAIITAAAMLSFVGPFWQDRGTTTDGVISVHHTPTVVPPFEKKTILTWTKFFSQPLDDKYFDMCPELRQNCTITVNRHNYADADVIVFHPRDMSWDDVPPKRTSNQRYAFLSHESPPHMCINLDVKPGFFNWSFTYRLDSDVPYPYYFRNRVDSAARPLNLERILNKSSSNTSSPIVWLASNCYTNSKRELYVSALRLYISVDIYGSCGPLRCPKTTQSRCEQMIETNYKFYLAFENSICTDYVSEKFYGRYELHAVPIVLSRRIAEPIFPPKSFIAVDDYPQGPQQLADYVKYLMSNDTAYLEYFHWRTLGYTYTRRNPSTGLRIGFCGMCEKLWQLDGNGGKHEEKIYHSVDKWWGEKASCDDALVSRLIAKEARLNAQLADGLRKPWDRRFICG